MTSIMTTSLKEVHDRLLACKPEGAAHDPDSCPLCAMEDTGEENMTTYTEDEVQAKVEEAVKASRASLDAEIADLKTKLGESEADQAVAAAVAEKDKEISELQSELDKAQVELGNVTAERDAIVAWLEKEKADQERAAEIAARKETRIEALKKVANFQADYLEKNADRFAAMSEEEFETRCAEYAALSGTSYVPGQGTSEIPSGVSGLKAGMEGPSGSGRSSAVKELFAMRRANGHVDLASL
jgi:hypothetical protein